MSPRSASQLTEMMRHVVEEGTGTAARLAGISVAGKTGTANKVDPLTHGYSETNYIASFVGFAPADNPKMVVAATIERTQGEGGTVAAPIAKQVLETLLGKAVTNGG